MRSNTITKHKNTKTKLEQEHIGVETECQTSKTGKSYMKPYRERTTNDFCEHWYYSQASYKDDHELLGYQLFEEGEDVM